MHQPRCCYLKWCKEDYRTQTLSSTTQSMIIYQPNLILSNLISNSGTNNGTSLAEDYSPLNLSHPSLYSWIKPCTGIPDKRVFTVDAETSG